MQKTKAQKEIAKLERQAKRTQAKTWRDAEALSQIVRAGKVTTEFYKQAMAALLCLQHLKHKTQANAAIWITTDETIQRLLQVASGINEV